MKKALLALLVALLVAGITVYATLVAGTYEPEGCTFELDLAELRALASSIPGDKPTEIRVEHVSNTEFPMAIACAGSSWDMVPFGMYAYQLVFPTHTMMIDTTMDRLQAEQGDMLDGYDDAAWERVAKGLTEASAIYVTHEHADHMGGAIARDTWRSKVHLTKQQLDSDVLGGPVWDPAARAAFEPFTYEKHHAVAPGVVLISAPGHTPGSQMVFVSRADGTELILTGDTAWIAANIEREQGPAGFVPLIMGSDRHANVCQLAALHRLQTQVPGFPIMPGHDKHVMEALLAKGVFVKGFK